MPSAVDPFRIKLAAITDRRRLQILRRVCDLLSYRGASLLSLVPNRLGPRSSPPLWESPRVPFPSTAPKKIMPTDRHGNPGRTIVERVVAKRASSPKGSDGRSAVEVQHLSLPWGMWSSPKENCNPKYAARTEVIEALVPEECFRFEREQFWPSRLNETAPRTCVEQAKITESDESSPWTCGAKCGLGPNDGYALYPSRFFVNITSHLQWYLSRGVDITVILAVRDKSISHAGKIKTHCNNEVVALMEEEKARAIMAEALERYGERNIARGGIRNDDNIRLKNVEIESKESRARVITVSYEGLMALEQSYLYDVYNQLGIESNYVPDFKNGNAKYVTSSSGKAT